MRKSLITLAACLLATSALAAPQEVSGKFKATEPLGQGSLTKLIFHAYDAELWTDAQQWSYEHPFALSLTYRMHFTVEELVDKSLEEMQRIHGTGAQYKQTLEKAFREVRDGDRITALYDPRRGTQFYHNGQPTSTVPGRDFAESFFDIWLSDKTSEPSMRKKLLNI